MLGLNKRKQLEITVSNSTVLRIIGFLIGTFLAIKFLINIIHPLTLIFVAFFSSLALNPAVTLVAGKLKNKSRVRATAIAYGAVTAVLIGFFMLVVPPLISQTTGFIRDVPQTLSELKDQDSSVGSLIRRYELEQQVEDFSNDWSRNLGSVQGPVLNTANRVVANVISMVTVFVLTFMMLVEGPKWLKALWDHVPEERRSNDKEIANKMYKVVTSYVNGQVLVASIGAVFALVMMGITSTILDVSVNVVAMAGIVFLFGLIPTVGAILGALLVTLFSLFVSPTMALAFIIYFIVYQQIENATIQPYIQSRGNELTPMLVFIAAILGIGFGGVLGGFVAIPFAGCVKVLVDDYLQSGEQEPVAKKKLKKAKA